MGALAAPRDTLWPLEPHTKAKHRILQAYLERWFPILASWHRRVIYFDGFAGPGRYAGGEPGSPIIALEVARNHRAAINAECVFTFVEERADRAAHLDQEIKALSLPAHFKPEVERGKCDAVLAARLDGVDAQGLQIAPTFAFIDPFGVTGIPFPLVERLLRRDRCEVFITFMTGTIQRFVTDLPAQVNELVGVPDAAAQISAASDRVLAARQLYAASLRRRAKFVRFFEMRNDVGVPVYDLFFATNHHLGHRKMKEAMWSVDESGDYSFRDGVDPAQARLFRDAYQGLLGPEMLKRFAGHTVSSEKVIEFVWDETAYLEKHDKGTLRTFETDGIGGKKVAVAEKKADGSKRKKGTFPDGTIIKFPKE